MPQEQESHIITTSKQFKEKLVSGALSGNLISLSDPSSAELMASLGFDFTIIDIQHSPIHTYDLQSLLMPSKAPRPCPLCELERTTLRRLIGRST